MCELVMENNRDGGEKMPAWEGNTSQTRKPLRWDLRTNLSSEVDLAIWTVWVMSPENPSWKPGRE